MPMLKEMWNVWMTGEQDSALRPLLSLLDNYGIRYDQGWIELVADPDELWPMGEDYKARYTISFTLPKALRNDPLFRERLNVLVPISPELDDDD